MTEVSPHSALLGHMRKDEGGICSLLVSTCVQILYITSGARIVESHKKHDRGYTLKEGGKNYAFKNSPKQGDDGK